MAPIIHLVRHAQGYHNLSVENESISDPDLTPLGETQCETLCNKFPSHDKITALAASPIRRTTYTCLQSFAPVVKAGVKITALPEAQEVSLMPCDVGSPVAKLKAEFKDAVDYSLVPDSWNDKSIDSKYYPVPTKLAARAREVRLWLRKLAQEQGDDAQIVLVSHGGILHFITEEWDDIELGKGTGWANTELRSYVFRDSTSQDPNASLQETEASWQGRRGSAIPLTPAEQLQQLEIFNRAGHIQHGIEKAQKVYEERAKAAQL